ncbi:MAG: hypothetical protein ACI4F4_10025 [Lachnospiraceae bacterium]
MKVDQEKLKKYEHIIDCEHPTFENHPPMDRMKRAAQFAPFSALTGYEKAIDETRKNVAEKWEDEYGINDESEKKQEMYGYDPGC